MKTLLLILLLGLALCVGAHPGVGIVMDSKGNVFYTDTERVWQIDITGRKSIVVPNVHTHELFLDTNNNLFGEHLWYESSTNQWAHYVWRYSTDGKFEKITPNTEGFLKDYSFVRDHFGNMYSANRDAECQQVVQLDLHRRKKLVSDHCFENIRWMYVTKSDELLLTDFQDLIKIDQRGNVKKVARQIANKQWTKSTVENQNAIFGIWDDAAGNIYTAVASNRVVKKFDQTGKEEIVFRTPAPWMPTGGLVSSTGELWILECSDTNAVRVEKVTTDARRIVY
ncbi:MAG: hypothetical protein KF775_17295 [Cyclobacteriaceae bacterium]|nr:hypothetical protein [Cyclobacteriaceae bacterium]